MVANRQLPRQRESWGSITGPDSRIRHRLALQTPSKATEDNPRWTYGEFHHEDAVKPQLHPTDQ